MRASAVLPRAPPHPLARRPLPRVPAPSPTHPLRPAMARAPPPCAARGAPPPCGGDEHDEWVRLSFHTISHYDINAKSFWEGTKDHDVDQNRAALLDAMGAPLEGKRVLDFGCGPGRDIVYFQSLGLKVTGLDGSGAFCDMARDKTGAEVLFQDFHELSLPAEAYDGIFCNASLFHIHRPCLPGALRALRASMAPGGILFANGFFMCYESWAALMKTTGFEEINHYYRPPGRPRAEQPWLASTWRKV